MHLSLNKLTSKYGKRVVLIFYIHHIKFEESQESLLYHSFLTVFSLLSMQQISSLFKHVCFENNCLQVTGFFQLGALYANIPFKRL